MSSSRSSRRLRGHRVECSRATCCWRGSGGIPLTATRGHRRTHPPSAGEDRARSEGPRVPVHGARRGLPVPRHGVVIARLTQLPRPTISLRNRLALVFFAITFVAIGGLYLYVAPGLQSRLINERPTSSRAQRSQIRPIAATVGGRSPSRRSSSSVNAAAASSGDRVTLLSVAHSDRGRSCFRKPTRATPGFAEALGGPNGLPGGVPRAARRPATEPTERRDGRGGGPPGLSTQGRVAEGDHLLGPVSDVIHSVARCATRFSSPAGSRCCSP